MQPGRDGSFVVHLECSMTGKTYRADQVQTLSDDGYPLLVRYDLSAISDAVHSEDLTDRDAGLWRYSEFLPVQPENIVSLGETTTPLVSLERSAQRLGASHVIVKDEGRLPTGSFKARGLVVAVSMAKQLGLTRLAIPTNGNAGAAR